ncbi:MAG: histidine phosphatase family protein [Candidatus Omnitrophica bacterium]|nr:histidine phosphatase family protein [Candidatus Omnitrophota bacterium]MDD5310724.1 histidine phosphatase family protein [Candidatus Omnitrophota bacterium]MDD5545592.1 histidine phosphatase family protein [Candidatus Omnitrophota bacterium]
MNLFILRHGESVWNKEDRVQGRKDPGLSGAGKRQAEAAGKRLKKEKIGIIYSSTLKRCVQTARIIARRTGAKIKFEPDMQEIILGVWQGKTIDEVKKLYPRSYAVWLKDPSKAGIPGWEGVPKFRKRVDRAFGSILGKDAAANVCVVTHWGVIAAHLAKTFDADFDRIFQRIRVDNCGISKISYFNGKGIIQCVNDTRHLS